VNTIRQLTKHRHSRILVLVIQTDELIGQEVRKVISAGALVLAGVNQVVRGDGVNNGHAVIGDSVVVAPSVCGEEIDEVAEQRRSRGLAADSRSLQRDIAEVHRQRRSDGATDSALICEATIWKSISKLRPFRTMRGWLDVMLMFPAVPYPELVSMMPSENGSEGSISGVNGSSLYRRHAAGST